MPDHRFVYVTYIATTPERLWSALFVPEMTRQYWDHDNVSDWTPDARWEHRRAGSGAVDVAGRVVEIEPPSRLVLTWGPPGKPHHAEKVTLELEPAGEAVRLRLTHAGLTPETFSDGGGWPAVLASLKTLLETGRPLAGLW